MLQLIGVAFNPSSLSKHNSIFIEKGNSMKLEMQTRKSVSAKLCILAFGLFSNNLFAATDYLVTACRPNLVVVADAKARKVIKTIEIPNTSMGNGPTGVVVSKDGKTAYVIHNRWETVSGFDIENGKEVFRAELSSSDIRAKAPFAIDLSPDGKELAVYVNPTRILPGEYKVEDPYIAIFDTSSGTNAEPSKKFPASRRITTLAYSPDYKRLYAFSWDMLILDPNTGKQIGMHPWRSWKRPNFGEPDALALWPQWDTSNVFAAPYYVQRTDKKPGQAGALRAGIWTLDLATNKTAFKDFEDASVVLFSTTINPVRRNEAYTVYTQLTKTDMNTGKMKRVDLNHTYYDINVSTDGKELYIGGTQDEIAVYDSKTLTRLGEIRMPNGADQVLSSLRLFNK